MSVQTTRRRRANLAAPRRRGFEFPALYDPDAFGRISERVARFFGTAAFLIIQTILVFFWILYNGYVASRVLHHLPFDPYPFILLNLAFSTQAAYAAPFILLAQNRQAERDRIQAETDRRTNARALADTEYMTRELAAIRLALGEMPTRDYLDDQLDRLTEELTELRKRVDGAGGIAGGGTAGV